MKKLILLLSFYSLVLNTSAQSVVVNSVFNANDPRDEWTEMLVVNDNTDMRGWTLRDNNSAQQSWQTAITFNNISFWNNMRAGTIIMVWHRSIASDGVTVHPTDVNKADGYIELDAQNTTYFTGGAFGTSPSWAGSTLNLATNADIVQLRNSFLQHVHALGYKGSPDTCWTNLPSPKLNHASAAAANEAVYVCPGSVLSEYDGASGTTLTARNGSTITFGLPNTCGASATGNKSFWSALRQPTIASQTVIILSIIPGNPGSATFNWSGATDPYSNDNTIGYIILRNTTNSFLSSPVDGTTYTVGNTIGGATVVGVNIGSANTSFTDNTVYNGSTYYYRVYAFRYNTDDLNGNNFNTERGRAYNETNYVTVNWPTSSPLPVEWLSFSAKENNGRIDLTWETLTEKNNDYFTLSKSEDGSHFKELVKVKGQGTTTERHVYKSVDNSPSQGISYYGLCQTDFDGNTSAQKIVSVEFPDQIKSHAFSLFPNPASNEVFILSNNTEATNVSCLLYDGSGRLLFNKAFDAVDSPAKIDLTTVDAGIYILQLTDADHSSRLKLIKH